MKITAGPPARGENFFDRENIIQKAWDLIESGNHILIAAPRRVGKTSVMYYLQDNPREGFDFLFLDTESVNNENEFFRRIVNKVLKADAIRSSQKIWNFLKKYMPSIKKIGPDGVEFGTKDDLNYLELLENILKSISDDKKKMVIMLDEFSQTLENIINDEGEAAGKHFLFSNRELRQDVEVSKNVHFIYTGSIGLENIVSRMNAIKSINDLSRLVVNPLTTAEAKNLIRLLLKNVEFELPEPLIDYILKKIEWLIPYYIQLIVQELKDLHREEKLADITEKDIDRAFEKMLTQRNHFDHWHTRLRAALKGDQYNFSKEILNIISENEIIHSNEIFNIAVKYKLENTFKDIIGSLVYDGYINNNEEPAVYRYNSPILRMWWRQNVAN
ncbi:MAG: AAA family ATPase [Desulfosalsimonadaceae bacterium]